MDRVMARVTESINIGKIVWKVAPFILVLLGRLPFKILADLPKVVIQGACQHKVLLAKLFADN